MVEAPKHYLNFERAVVFQLTAVVGMAAGGLASYGLKTYTNQQTLASSYGATLMNMPISAAGGLVITSGALAGTAIGLLFLTLMLRPGHSESLKSVRIKEIVSGILTIFSLIAALVSTVTTAKGSASLITTGLSVDARYNVRLAIGNLRYKSSAVNVAIAILSFLSFALMTTSTFLISRAARYVYQNGPTVGVKQGFQERLASPYLNKILGPGVEGQKLNSSDNSTDNSLHTIEV